MLVYNQAKRNHSGKQAEWLEKKKTWEVRSVDNLEKVVAELKHLDGDELNKVWGFALGLLASRPVDQAA